MKDFKITITNVDMQDPAKLACVEAIVGSDVMNEEHYPTEFALWGITPNGFSIYETPYRCFSLDESEITLLYSQIKLDPRKLIGEDVECFYVAGIYLTDDCEERTNVDMKINNLDGTRYDFHKKHNDTIKLSPTWLKQNFKCEEV